jgi:hypothetical protein
MRTWQKALLIVIPAGLATWGLVANWGDAEPSYEGKPLNYWVAFFHVPKRTSKPTAQQAKATEAIRHMGTNAFPPLIEWLRYDNTIARNHFWSRVPLGIRKFKPAGALVFYSPKMQRAVDSCWALITFGRDASPAFPALAELFITTTNFEVRTRCMVIFREIGPPTLPTLTAAAADKRSYTNHSIEEILWTMQQIGPRATSAVPALRTLLQDADPATKCALSNAITHITGEPSATLQLQPAN